MDNSNCAQRYCAPTLPSCFSTACRSLEEGAALLRIGLRAPILVVTFSHSKTVCSPASFALERLFSFLFFLYQLSLIIPLTLQVEPWRADATLCDRACRGTMQWAFETREINLFFSFFFRHGRRAQVGYRYQSFFFPFTSTLLPLTKALCLLADSWSGKVVLWVLAESLPVCCHTAHRAIPGQTRI